MTQLQFFKISFKCLPMCEMENHNLLGLLGPISIGRCNICYFWLRFYSQKKLPLHSSSFFLALFDLYCKIFDFFKVSTKKLYFRSKILRFEPSAIWYPLSCSFWYFSSWFYFSRFDGYELIPDASPLPPWLSSWNTKGSHWEIWPFLDCSRSWWRFPILLSVPFLV